MIYLIAFINGLALILCVNFLNSKRNIKLKLTGPIRMHSYKTTFNIKSYIESRYLIQTFLKDKINVEELILFYMLWCISDVTLYILNPMNPLYRSILLVALGLLPIFVLEQYIKHIDLAIDKGLFNLLAQINARLVKSEDILSALQETQNSINNKYILKVLSEFNQSIRLGLPSSRAFSRVQSNTINEYLKYIFLNIEIVYMRRGNILELMRALENEYTSIQIEINKRKIELEHERNLTILSVTIVLFLTMKIVNDNDYIITFYIENPGFSYILGLFILLGFGFVIKASLKKY